MTSRYTASCVVWEYVRRIADHVPGSHGSPALNGNLRLLYRLFGFGNLGERVAVLKVIVGGVDAEQVVLGTRSATVLGHDPMPAHVALAAVIHPSPPDELAAVGSMLVLSGEVVLGRLLDAVAPGRHTQRRRL